MLAEDIKIYLRWSFVLAMFPLYHKETRTFRILRILPLAYIFLAVATFSWAFAEWSHYLGLTTTMHQMLQPLIDTTMQVHTIMLLNFWKLPQVQRLFDVFNDVDQQLRVLHHTNPPRLRFVGLSFVLINLLYAVMTLLDIVTFGQHLAPLRVLLYYSGDWLTAYCLHISETLKTILVWSLLARFQALNTVLKTGNDKIMLLMVENQIKLHQKCADLVAIFNDIYGWNLLVSIVQTIVYIILLADLLLNPESGDRTYVYFLIMWTIYSVIQTVAITAMCEKVVDEGKKTVTIAYKTLYRYANVPAIREKFLILAQQATARCPRFTAAGFFNVDFAMLFTFVNLITTYIIVIIQFSTSSGCNPST